MKKNNITKSISILILTLLVIASCSKDEGSSDGNNVIENKTPTQASSTLDSASGQTEFMARFSTYNVKNPESY